VLNEGGFVALIMGLDPGPEIFGFRKRDDIVLYHQSGLTDMVPM
jgi:hypothetical protein